MALYVFDYLTPETAAAFTASDFLSFRSDSVTAGNLAVTLEAGGIGLALPGSGVSPLVFSTAALTAATQNGQIVFANGSSLVLGSAASETLFAGSVPGSAMVHGFGGNDTLTAGSSSDTLNGGDGDDVIRGSSSSTDDQGNWIESDYYFGGAGADVIAGGDGNDHIYGNSATSIAGASDGGDTIDAGGGNDYVRGNAGDDSISGGDGNDRLEGSADNDTVRGGAGNDTVNGNKGNDVVAGDDGDDTVGGGQGNDLVSGDAGNDTVNGGIGDDTLSGGSGIDLLTGGAGADVFVFTGSDAPITNGVAGGRTDIITDYVHGIDHIDLDFAVATVLATPGTVYASFADAQGQALTLLAANPGTAEVAALRVGSDAYVFYGGSAVQLAGVDPAVLTTADFI